MDKITGRQWKKRIEFKAKDLASYHQWIEAWSKNISAPCLILLDGPLGSGKTEFVKHFVAKKSPGVAVSSPTFNFRHSYAGEPVIEHWDLYRLKSEDDLESLGFWETIQGQDSIIFIEWPNILKAAELPRNKSIFKLKISQEDQDRIYELSELG